MRFLAAGLLALLPGLCSDWQPIGPFGGSAAFVQTEPRGGAILAATANAQLFRSEDGGDSWEHLPFPAELRATLHAFVVDPWNPGVYWAGLSSDVSLYSGIFRSSDRGVTWKRVGDPRLKSVWAIALFPQDSRLIAAGNEDGVFLSQDAGERWETLTPPGIDDMRPVVSLSYDPADPNVLYLGTPHLAWKTSDGGATWSSIHKGMLDDSDVFSILVDDRQRRRIFAATCGGIYRSIDGGAKWARLSPSEGVSYRSYFIAQHPRLPNVLFAGTAAGLMRSNDSGATWQKLSSESTRSLAFDSAESGRIFVATDEGLFRSEDLGATFEPINQGFSNRRIRSLASLGNTLYVSMDDSSKSVILELDEDETTWREAAPGELPPEVLDFFTSRADDSRGPSPASDFNVYRKITTQSNGLLAATSGGLKRLNEVDGTWATVPGILAIGSVTALCKHPVHPHILFAAQYGKLYQSVDDGRTWSAISPGDADSGSIQSLVILESLPNRLFVLTQGRGVYSVRTLPSGSSPSGSRLVKQRKKD
jgi:photosystem II stability/assembly factor-like uncharacterized protein